MSPRPPRTGKVRHKAPVAQEFFRGAQLMVDREEPDVSDEFPEVADPRKRLFLQYIAKNGPRYGAAAKAAGVSQVTTWHWRNGRLKDDPAFEAGLLAAIKMGVDALESEFIRRGFQGVEKPVYQGGRLVGTLREYDTTAGIVMLKALAPERHRERYEYSGPGGGPVQLQAQVQAQMALLSDEDLRARVADLAAQLAQPPALPPGLDPGGAPAASSAEAPDGPEAAYARRLADRARARGNGHGDGNGHGPL